MENKTTQTVVSSYVRHKQVEVEPEHDNTVNVWTARIVVIVLLVILWQVTVPVLLLSGAAYGLKTILASDVRTIEPEAVTEPVQPSEPKVKRHYQHRLRVTHYETGKTIRV